MSHAKVLSFLVVLSAAIVLISASGPVAPPAAPRADTSGMTGAYSIDTVHSSVLFRVMHNRVAPFWGRFDRFTGEIVVDADTPANNRVSMTIDAASVSTANEKRDQHLRHTDFFSVKEFPEITFTSDSVVPAGEDEYRVEGQLTLLGKRQPVTMTITRTGAIAGPRDSFLLGFEGSFTILRSDFGMDYGQGNLGDEVRVTLGLELVRR